MAKSGINLINKGFDRILLLSVLRKKAKIASAVLTLIFILLSLIAFGVSFYLSNLSEKNKRKIVSLKSQIDFLSKTESYLVTISDRVKNINTVLSNRITYFDGFSYLNTIFVPGFSLTNLELSSSKRIKAEGKCDDIQCLTNFNEKIELIKANKVFKEATYSQVGRHFDGKYGIYLEMSK